jgi:hypothetical protein
LALEALKCGPSTDTEKCYFGAKSIRNRGSSSGIIANIKFCNEIFLDLNPVVNTVMDPQKISKNLAENYPDSFKWIGG